MATTVMMVRVIGLDELLKMVQARRRVVRGQDEVRKEADKPGGPWSGRSWRRREKGHAYLVLGQVKLDPQERQHGPAGGTMSRRGVEIIGGQVV